MINLVLALALQAAAPAPVPAKEQLTTIEKQGLTNILKQYQEVLQELSQANIDITKTHPGYHLDPKNPFSGDLVKDEKPKEQPAKTETPEKK